MRTSYLSLFALGLSLAVVATAAQAEEQLVKNIEAMESLPTSGWKMVKANGKTFFLSDNGRYAIIGTMYDMVAGQRIETIEQLRDVASRIDFDKSLGKAAGDLLSFTYGTGPKKVRAFVAPGCHYCAELIDQMKPLLGEYTFELLPIPLANASSQQALHRLACAPKEQGVKALIAEDFSKLPDGQCPLDPAQKTLVTFKVLGGEGVPLIIAPDGRVHRGGLQDLAGFLAAGSPQNSAAPVKQSSAAAPTQVAKAAPAPSSGTPAKVAGGQATTLPAPTKDEKECESCGF